MNSYETNFLESHYTEYQFHKEHKIILHTLQLIQIYSIMLRNHKHVLHKYNNEVLKIDIN